MTKKDTNQSNENCGIISKICSTLSPQNLKENPLIAIIAVTVIVVIIAIAVSRDKTAGTYEAEVKDEMKYFTNFRDKMNSVGAIRMISQGQTFNVQKLDDKWFLPDRHAYPVSIDKVRDIVINASELEILEKKTNDPEKLDLLGLDDPEKEDSKAVRITLYTKSGQVLSDFIAGDRRRSGGRTFYARNVDNPQAYLVKGEAWLRLDLSPNYWLNSEVFKLAKDEVEKATIKHADKKSKTFTIARSHAGARKFRIDDLGKRQIKSDSDVTNVAFSLDTLVLQGVAPHDFIEFKKGKVSTIIYKTFSGMKLVIDSTEDKDGDRWIKVHAIADGAGIKPETTKKAKEINDTVKDWIYIVSEDTANLLTSKFEDLTEVAKK